MGAIYVSASRTGMTAALKAQPIVERNLFLHDNQFEKRNVMCERKSETDLNEERRKKKEGREKERVLSSLSFSCPHLFRCPLPLLSSPRPSI